MTVLNILIVDDNEASAKTLGWMMELLEHNVKLAHDGAAAIELAKSFQPDVVLLDIGLPGMNGYEVCTAMRKEPSLETTVFIAQTGWGQNEHRERSREAGFHYHLVKPIDMDELQRLIESLRPLKEAKAAHA
ncbi:MAG: response regulator [Rickettsiales bacterium]